MAKPLILDCTLRDGGYYTNWTFDDETVQSYLNEVATSSYISWVELGLRVPQAVAKGLGIFAMTSDFLLTQYSLPDANYAVLINAKDYLCSTLSDTVSLLRAHFDYAENSRVEMVRVAFTRNETRLGFFLIRRLKELGYEVCANLMQADTRDIREICSIYNEACVSKCYAFYFADSFGRLEYSDVEGIVTSLTSVQETWRTSTWEDNDAALIGFHAHDNIGNAFSNAQAAIKGDIDILDSTILGMGRGAGNLDTNTLVSFLYNKELEYPETLHEFEELKKVYKWGHNEVYAKAAYAGIHPAYPQYFLAKAPNEALQLVGKLKALTKTTLTTFSETIASSILAEGV